MSKADRMSAPDAADRFRSAVKSLARFSNFLAILAVPTFLAIWLELATPERVGRALFWSVLASVIAIQLVLFLITTRFAGNLPELHVQLEDERDQIQVLKAELTTQQEVSARLEAASELGIVWSTMQGLLPSFGLGTSATLSKAVEVASQPMIWAARPLFKFEYNDVWSIAVYGYDATEDILKPVWFKRHEKHPRGNKPPRSWKPGDGHVGSAFMRERTLYTIDAAADDASALVQPSRDNERDYDATIYRSFISAPILLEDAGGASRKYGVIVLTSDVPGRFDAHNQGIMEHAAQVLAHLFDADRLATQSTGP